MTGLLLRLYPRPWRIRYGAELEELLVASSGGRVSWRDGLDVAAGAFRERLRAAGLAGDPPPAERTRGGALLVLCAWALFVVGGVGVQKFSEHWQGAMPNGGHGVPFDAFDVLIGGAAVGSALVVAGVLAALPALLRFLRDGGWPLVRPHLVAASVLTVCAGAGVAGLALWAHGLTGPQRNGSDAAYTAVAVLVALLLAACVLAWTAAAVACGRRLHLTHGTLRLEAMLAVGVVAAMAAMTAATAVWWAALARSADPAFFGGSAVAPQLVVATLLMLAATLSGALGARQAVRGALAA